MNQAPTPSLRRDLRWHADGGRGGGVVVEDDIAGRFTRLGREAVGAAKQGSAAALAIAAQHRLCRDRRMVGQVSRWDPRRLMSMRIEIIQGDRLASWLADRTDAIFSAKAVTFWAIVGVVVAIGLVGHGDSLQRSLNGNAVIGNAVIGNAVIGGAVGGVVNGSQGAALMSWQIGAVLLFTKVLHEFAHAAVCRRMGAAAGSMGVMIFCGMPCPYCDVTDAWRLPSRDRRAAVMAAGIYIEWVIATIAGLVFLSVDHDPTRQAAAMSIIVCFVGAVVFNANPLMRYDGYYVMADKLGSVNLSADASAAFDAVVVRPMLGQSSVVAAANRRTIGLAVYHVARLIYRIFVLASISGLIIYAGGVIGMQRAALGLVVCMLSVAASRPLARMLRFGMGRSSRTSDGGGPPQKNGSALWRRIALCGFLPIMMTTLMFAPLPRWTTIDGVITPVRVQLIEPHVDGVITRIDAVAGKVVVAGQSILRVESEPLEFRETTLRGHLAITDARLRSTERAMTSGDYSFDDRSSGDGQAGGERWRGLQQQRQSLEVQLASLRQQCTDATLHAELDGVILGPPISPSSKSDQWLHLSRDDMGRVVQKGQPIARVGSRQWCVEIQWPLADSPPVAIGDPVIVTVRRPNGEHQSMESTIETISPIRQSHQPSQPMIRLRCTAPEMVPVDDGEIVHWMDSAAPARVIHRPTSLAWRGWRWTRRYVMTEAWR